MDTGKYASATDLAKTICDRLGIKYKNGKGGCTLDGEPIGDAETELWPQNKDKQGEDS